MKPKETGKRIGYARVSSDDQELRLQIDALTRAKCWNIYQEKASAYKARRRPQLELALTDLRSGDTLVVWRLDRLGRDMRELIRLLDRVRETGAGFISLSESIDLTTPFGKLMFHVIGAFAQFESDSTAFRTKAGITAIQERGMRYGAKPRLSEKQAADLVQHRVDGKSVAWLAKRYKMSEGSVRNYLRRDASQEDKD